MAHKYQSRIDKAANDYNRTKDEKYKKLWYDLIRKADNGSDYSDRRDISSGSVTKELIEDMVLVQETDLFELCDILRLKLTTYIDAPFNAHVMNDGSGDFIGCISK